MSETEKVYVSFVKQFCSKCKLNDTCQHNFDFECKQAFNHLYLTREEIVNHFNRSDVRYDR